MDLLQFEVEDTTTLELTDSDENPILGDDGNPATVEVWGPGSKPYNQAKTKQSNKYLNRMKKKGSFGDASAEDRAKEDAVFLAACTVSFSDNFTYNGKPASESVLEIYMNPKLGFISDQVAKHIGEWSNFTKGSTTE